MEEWKEYKVAEVIDEISMGPFGSNIKRDNYVDSGVPYLNGSNLSSYKLNEDSFNYVTEEKANSLGRCVAKRGDVIVTHRGTIGQISYIPNDSKYERYLTGNSQFRLTVNNKLIRPDFFVYYFHTRMGQYRLLANASQVGVPALARPTSTFKETSVPVPKMEIQNRIMEILHSLDDKIAVNKKICENLEAQAQALFKSWFVDYEPFRSKPFVESEIGMIPEGWSVVSLGEILEDNNKSKIQVKQARDIKGEYPFFTSGTTILEYDEFLVSGRNIFLNTGGVAGVNFYIGKAAYSTDTWCIKGKDDLTDFLYLYLSSVIDIINTQYFEGSALKHLKKKALKERKIAIPSMYIIDGFIKTVMPLFDKMISNKRQNRILSQLRDTLLPKLMSGQIKL